MGAPEFGAYRAGRATPRAPAGLGHSATITAKVRAIACASCGKFILYADIDSGAAKNEFEPLSEFGPERSEWFCRRCA